MEAAFDRTIKNRQEAASAEARSIAGELRAGRFNIDNAVDRALKAVEQAQGVLRLRGEYLKLGIPPFSLDSNIVLSKPILPEIIPIAEEDPGMEDKTKVGSVTVVTTKEPSPERSGLLDILKISNQPKKEISPVDVNEESEKFVVSTVPNTSDLHQAPVLATRQSVLVRKNSSIKRGGIEEVEPSMEEISEWYEKQMELRGGDPEKHIANSGRREIVALRLMHDHRSAIIYQDDHILAVNKPSGVNTHHGRQMKIGVEEIFRYHYQDGIAAAHRIDRETSGVLVFARTPEALAGLKDQFADHSGTGITKVHVALLDGNVRHNGEIKTDIAIAPDPEESGRMKVVDPRVQRLTGDARSTLSYFLPIAYFEHMIEPGVKTLVQVRIITGRQHQVRVSALHLGAPIYGDDIYNDKRTHGQRLMLHHIFTGMSHPITGESLELPAPVAEDFRKALGYMDRKGVDRGNLAASMFVKNPELARALTVL